MAALDPEGTGATRHWLTALIELCFTDFMASEIVTGYTGAQMQRPLVGEKDPSYQVKRVQCPRSVEGSRQQGEIRLGEFLSPPEQAHDDKEISLGKKRMPSFDTAIEYGAVVTIATEKTRTAKSAVRATCCTRRCLAGFRRRGLAKESIRQEVYWAPKKEGVHLTHKS